VLVVDKDAAPATKQAAEQLARSPCLPWVAEKVLSTGDVFYEAPGSIHLPSGSARITKPARILALAFAEKGKEITKLL